MRPARFPCVPIIFALLISPLFAQNNSVPGSSGNPGTVTSVATGCGLAGGPVTGTGTISGTGPCWAAGGGTAQAQTATYSPAATLTDGMWVCWKPTAANSGAAPTFSPNGLTAHTIVRQAGVDLVANDIITTAQACAIYNSTGTQWELQNPQTTSACPTCAVTTSPISQLASTTSAQLAGTLSDETGTGPAVFSVSPALTGTPTAPTPAQGDNSTTVPNTSFVARAIADAIAGVNPAVAVLAASTATVTGTYLNGVAGIGATFTVTATGTFSLDGIAINTIGQRVLLKDQSSGFQNGVYTATIVGALAVSPVFTRALDYDTPSDINSTGAIPVQSGTVNGGRSYLLTSTVNTVGTDALTYIVFSYAAAVTRVRGVGYTFDGNGAVLTTGNAKYLTVPYSCTISAWNIVVDTGTTTVDVWKIATGTAKPTVANTITASALPAISTGTAIHSTTLTSWTTSVAANDIFGFNVTAVSGATQINIVLECDQ